MSVSNALYGMMCMVFLSAVANVTPVVVEKTEQAESHGQRELTFELGEPVVLRAGVDIPAGKHAIRWRVRGDVKCETMENDTILVVGWKPGRYEAEFLFIDFDAGELKEELFVIVMGDKPPPETDPTPDPEPDDEVTTTPTKAVVVFESSEHAIAPHAMAAREAIEDAGIEYRITDDDAKTGTGETPEDVRPAIEAARSDGGGFPVLVILSGDSARVVPLPATVEGIVKEVTGG